MPTSTSTTAPPRTPQAVVEEYFARLQRRDETAFDLVAEDFVNHGAATQGRAGVRAIAHVLDRDLGGPDIRILHVVAAGDLVALHRELVGTHVGSSSPLLSAVAPTGKPLTWTFMDLFRVSAGQLAEHWACHDDLGLLVQLGAIAPPVPASS
jgi:predicted SnoaL-like aldol condensation-catalyzing enzyme